MIFTERQITVHKGKSSINEPVILYRGDFEVSIKFTIMESKFRFKSGVNLVDSEKASFGQLAILAPYGGNVFSEIVKCEDGTITFTLTKEMIDQLEEVGLYSFQIRLFDYYRESRVSIPPVEFGIEVREPVASEDHDNEVNNAIVGYSIAKVVDGLNGYVGPTFDADGQYNKTDWETGDRITEGKLNKIEDALDKINKNEINDKNFLNKQMTSNFNVLQSQIEHEMVTKLELEVEKNRIDSFTKLEEGCTTGDAELIDARVGANGVVYNTLGDANRAQFASINKLANTSSCKFVNLIEDAKLTNVNKWNCRYGSLTLSNNIAEWTIKEAYDNNNRIDIKSKIIDFNSNDVYYCCFNAFSTRNATSRIYIGDGFTEEVNIQNNTWNFVSGVRKVSANNELGFYINNLIGCVVETDLFKVKNVVCVNLTKTFGSGFEPSKECLDRFFKQNTLANELLVDKNEFNVKGMDSIIIASNSSKYIKYADYITSGFNDQELINNIISSSNVKNIYFTSDSIFNITSEIILKSNIKIYSNGATFTTPDVISTKTIETCSPGEQYFHVDFEIDKFIPGMYVEIYDYSKWETRYITSIDYKTKKIYFDKPLENRYEKGATIRNVSSCFSGSDVENVTIEGLTIDWNFSKNIMSNDTFYAQNGIHLIGGSNCIIKDCNIINGGRHGILFIKSKYSKILNCRLDNWGEHGIDIYNELNSSIPKTYNTIDNCVCINCGENGIQLHGGSGVTITNCTCNNNISNGIGMLGKAHSNVLSNNSCCENGINGIYMKAGIYNITINSNNLSFNKDSGINMSNNGYWYTANCDSILIGFNRINNNECCGIYMGGVDNSIISNNIIFENSSKTGSTNSISIALEKTCLYNKISDNNIKSSKANALYGVKEITEGCDYNIIINNIIQGVANGVEVKGTNSIDNGNVKL